MWDKNLQIKQVDKIITELNSRKKIRFPKKGWINLIRTSLGMSTRALGERIGLSQSRVSLIEKGEVEGSLTLNTLEKVAEGLNCDVVYYFVPKEGDTLEGLREKQAFKKADFLNSYTEIHMSLEKQSTSPTFQSTNRDKIKEELLKKWPRDFWDIK
ncbi:mobile mystery protein A [Brenneria uluponensis]|uniref:mobile mystery protein A n=1 Tax=Brenneria uluponensis TaxID=3057057 RepID=UPI0028EDE230|nr:mobile mystery protein A [Brenneria ulupoensis]